MVTGASSLSMVRTELFTTIEQAEKSLEQFIADRSNVSYLQQGVEYLQQIRGILKLVEVTGAEMLAQETLLLATDIPVGAGQERDAQLTALTKALFILRRYLERIDLRQHPMPELLLPMINELRQCTGQPRLPESYFFRCHLERPRPNKPVDPRKAAASMDSARLRQMYQLGVTNIMKNHNVLAAIKLVGRSLARMDELLGAREHSRLIWVGGITLEAMADTKMPLNAVRKQLIMRLDRELRQLLAKPTHEPPRVLLKEFLYLLALTGDQGPRTQLVFRTYGIPKQPYGMTELAQEARHLSGPGQEVMHSLSLAIAEELAGTKDLLDLIERNAAKQEDKVALYKQVHKLSMTLGMIGQPGVARTLKDLVPVIGNWARSPKPPADEELLKLADSLLYVESLSNSMEQGDQRQRLLEMAARLTGSANHDNFASHLLLDARVVVISECLSGLSQAKGAITAYLESGGDKSNLENVPESLHAVRGGLWFLGLQQAASLVGASAHYIDSQMIQASCMPSEQMLETLADALTSLEFYLEGSVKSRDGQPDVLALAASSIKALGINLNS